MEDFNIHSVEDICSIVPDNQPIISCFLICMLGCNLLS